MNNVKYVSTQVPITIEHFGVPGMRKGMRKQRALNRSDVENDPKAATQDSSASKSSVSHHAAIATVKPGQAPMGSTNAPKNRPEGKVISKGYVSDIAKHIPFNAKYHELSFSDILNSVDDNL